MAAAYRSRQRAESDEQGPRLGAFRHRRDRAPRAAARTREAIPRSGPPGRLSCQPNLETESLQAHFAVLPRAAGYRFLVLKENALDLAPGNSGVSSAMAYSEPSQSSLTRSARLAEAAHRLFEATTSTSVALSSPCACLAGSSTNLRRRTGSRCPQWRRLLVVLPISGRPCHWREYCGGVGKRSAGSVRSIEPAMREAVRQL